MRGKWLLKMISLAMILCCFSGCNGEKQELQQVTFYKYEEPKQPSTPENLLPTALINSSLVIEKLISYQGTYWEDMCGDYVENVAGLMVYNPTERAIAFGAFSLKQNGKQLYFFVYQLPPKSRCLVLEKNRAQYSNQEITDVQELCVRWDYQELSRQQVDYLGLGQEITIINRDARQMNHLAVCYKRYVYEEGYYLGGAAFSAHLFFLQSQERRTVIPPYYDAGYAKIVSIRQVT